MNSVILCEGIYDLRILGYYIYKSFDGNWARCQEKEKLKLLSSARIPNEHHGMVEIYLDKGKNNVLILWSVGGKASFKNAIKDVCRINNIYPEQGFEQIAILVDRDNDNPNNELKKLTEIFAENGWQKLLLANNKINKYSYRAQDGSDDTYEITVTPIIIPFDENGAMETVLVNAIASRNDENKFIVQRAKLFIGDLKDSTQVCNYLQKPRDVVKANYSAVIAVVNPEHGSSKYNELLLSTDWENSDVFNECFGILKSLLQ